MRDHRKAEEIAAERIQLLSPLLAEGVDAAKARKLKAQICAQTGISERTLRRYLARYRENGFGGLKPKGKGERLNREAVPANVLEQAVLLRREVPGRSVAQIIQVLEWEGLVEPGRIKRSTLQEKLVEKGYSARHMRMYADTGVAARRFQKRYRNQLWHSDIKYGPYLPIGPDGAKKQVYLVSFFDDATRFIVHGEFYPTLDQRIVEDCFRQSIRKYGAPEAVFFDNGKQYRTKWMTRACAKMGIRLLFAKPYAPEATGKVERFNRMVDAFLAEAALEKPQSLDKLNALFWVWLEECYQNKPHSALGNNRSPAAAYQSDSKAIRFLDAETVAAAFLHCEERKVDKAGCISFAGKKYEVDLNFIGCKVDVVYDPADTAALTIEYEGHAFTVKPLVIGEQTGKRPRLPEHLQQEPAASSRLLTAAGLRHQQRFSPCRFPPFPTGPFARGRPTRVFEEFFRLAHTPFTRDIPTSQLYPSVMLEETLGRLEHAAKRQLFIVFTGDSGTGKTTAIRRFKDTLDPARFLVMYLADSKLTPRHFYKGLLEQLGCQAKFYRGDAKRQLHREIELMRGVHSLQPVVILDEAHLLDKEMLEEVRFLLNFKMDSISPMALILVGQSELLERLRLQAYAAIRQRIDLQCRLTYLDRAQTGEYVKRHLAYAGADRDVFSDGALDEVFRFSAGAPRLINKACTHCLIYGAQNGNRIVDDHMVKRVIQGELI